MNVDNRGRKRDHLREKKDALVKHKGGKCYDCGGSFPNCCFTFDHRNPMEKSFTVSDFTRKLEECLEEIEKCDLVCANCHAIRTAGNPIIKQKRSMAMIGKPRSAQTKKKVSESLRGHKVSQETREKIRAALTGRKYV